MRGIPPEGFVRLARFVAQLDEQLSIEWVPPDLADEVGEYLENDVTKEFLSSQGIELGSADEVIEFLSTGAMTPFSAAQISQAENTSHGEEFDVDLMWPEYRESFDSMEGELTTKGSITLPAPILLKVGGIYWGFSGNRRTNLAIKHDLPLEVWLVEVDRGRFVAQVMPLESFDEEYPLAGGSVSGYTVGSDIPNMGSISASLVDYTVLKGIRELSLPEWNADPFSTFYAADDHARAKNLAEEIRSNGYVDPLIVVVGSRGPYILEGIHRLVALHLLGAQSFPALVVVDDESFDDSRS